jgi:hypothetical protein
VSLKLRAFKDRVCSGMSCRSNALSILVLLGRADKSHANPHTTGQVVPGPIFQREICLTKLRIATWYDSRCFFFPPPQFTKKRFLSEGIWLLFLNATTQEAFGDEKLPFSSLVVVAKQINQVEVLLEEVYRVGPHSSLVFRPAGSWDSMREVLLWTGQAVRRNHLRGLTVRAATIHVSNVTRESSAIIWKCIGKTAPDGS